MPDAFRIAPARSGSYPVRDGNAVCALVDGIPAYRRICEAVAAAERSVWATIAFVDRNVVLPDDHGTLFDVLDRAAARGLDVRVVFWREPRIDPAPGPGWEHFPGNPAERAWLAARGTAWTARWDHLPRGCHHQKSWVIDAGEDGEVAFVGGINMDRMSLVDRGHRAPSDLEHYHDVYCEIAGPCAADVHHNFVQRWNEASERGRDDGVWPPGVVGNDLEFPRVVGAARGESRAQIVRTVRDREQSILETYSNAIDAARAWIYIENQFVFHAPIFERIDAALRRGVEVFVLVPGAPLPEVREARKRDPRLFDALAALGRHEGFTLARLVYTEDDGRRRDVYVHSKMMIVDDEWMTIGSANLERASLERATELNVVCWDAEVVAGVRGDLFAEHGVADGAVTGPRGAARTNARDGRAAGLLVALDPARYAMESTDCK